MLIKMAMIIMFMMVIYISFLILGANRWKRDSHDGDQYHASPKKMLTETTMMMVRIETTSFTNVPTAGWDCSLNDGYTAAQCAYHPPFDSQDDDHNDEYYGYCFLKTHIAGIGSLGAIKRILSSDGSHPPG